MNPFDFNVLTETLAEPSRRALLETLRSGRKSVGDLVQTTGLKQPNVSNHLAKMRRQGLVHAARSGRQVYYALTAPVAEILRRLQEVAGRSLPAGRPAELPAASLARLDASSGCLPAERERLLSEWRESYFHAILAAREDHAAALVTAMSAHRMEMETIYAEVFAPALIRIGDLYAQGLTDEAHEHIAAAITERMMARMTPFYTFAPPLPCRAILGCVAENRHVLGLRMLADGLKRHGWKTLFVGADVPTESFLALAVAESSDLVAISCSLESQLLETRRLVERLDSYRQSEPKASFRIAVGGHFPREHPEALAGWPVDLTSADLIRFLADVRSLYPSVQAE